ncbi:MAG: metallophosphoesterase, partial [Clostridia bacterium]|nr:metallophosphoesterase [Clostridia bacterium]
SMMLSLSLTVFAADTEETVLRFRKDGTFKILVLADVQDVYPIDDAMISFINEALDYAKPDLVVFDGDNIVTEDVRAYEQLLYPLVSRNVPFTFVFGNHDVERENFTAEQQLAEYQKYPGCLAYDADPALHGCATHNLLIYSSKGNDIAFNLWFMDSGTSLRADDGEWLGYDWVRADQIEWYNNTRDAITEANGGKLVHSIAFQHIIPKEAVEVLFYESDVSMGELTYNFNDGSVYSYIPKIETFDGYIFEKSCPGNGSDGQWDAMKAGGDVLALVVGHDHVNSFVADINGIDLVQTPGATYHSYYNNMLQGARVIELDEGDLDSYYTYELTSSMLATQSGSEIADGGVRSEASYSISNIMLPIFNIFMDLLRDVFKAFTNSTPEIV